MMGGLLCFDLNSLDGGTKTGPKDNIETLWLAERGTVILYAPKIVILKMCIAQRYYYCLYCKIIDISSG